MGFIGIHLSKKLISNYKVYGIDIKDLNEYFKSKKKFIFNQVSVLDYKRMDSLISKVDVVIHLAAIASPERYLTEPLKTMDISALAAIEIAKICAKYKKLLVFSSTSEIYGNNKSLPYSESSDRVLGSTKTTRWCYSTSKSLVEHYIYALNQELGLKFIIIRFFNVYGPFIEGRVIDKFILNALKNKKITVYGDGKQTRCFLYVSDCINAIIKVLRSKNCINDSFNIGNMQQTSVNELLKKILKFSNSGSKVEYLSYKKLKKNGYEDIYSRQPNNSHLVKSVKWKPQVSLDLGIQKTINFFKKNIKNYS